MKGQEHQLVWIIFIYTGSSLIILENFMIPKYFAISLIPIPSEYTDTLVYYDEIINKNMI